jgi:hypothetical protein
MHQSTKDKIRISLLVNDYSGVARWESLSKDLEQSGIETFIAYFPEEDNYRRKIRWATSQNFEYSIKMDEDCFMNQYMWEFMINHAFALDDPQNLMISPVLSNGIPSCEFFIHDILTEAEQSGMYKSFQQHKFAEVWNMDYSILNECTVDCYEPWTTNRWFETLDKIDTPLKGIHPIRFSPNAHFILNLYVLAHIREFLENHNFYFHGFKSPYTCNSIFLAKTKLWHDTFHDKSLCDRAAKQLGTWAYAFDEIQLNEYRHLNDMNVLFIRGGFGIHSMFNTLYKFDSRARDYENNFVQQLALSCP